MKKFSVGFSYVYTNSKGEKIVGVLNHINRQGDRFWCKETDPHGNIEERNYNHNELEKISS